MKVGIFVASLGHLSGFCECCLYFLGFKGFKVFILSHGCYCLFHILVRVMATCKGLYLYVRQMSYVERLATHIAISLRLFIFLLK